MPDVVDYTFRAGYWKHGLYVPVSFSQQITLGGDDIRRQDMPFVSNRMNSSRVDAARHVLLQEAAEPGRARLGASRDRQRAQRRQSTTLLAGLLYTFKF